VHEQRAIEQQRRGHVLEQVPVRLEDLDGRDRRQGRDGLGRIHRADHVGIAPHEELVIAAQQDHVIGKRDEQLERGA
jgi:hypothetical protein